MMYLLHAALILGFIKTRDSKCARLRCCQDGKMQAAPRRRVGCRREVEVAELVNLAFAQNVRERQRGRTGRCEREMEGVGRSGMQRERDPAARDAATVMVGCERGRQRLESHLGQCFDGISD